MTKTAEPQLLPLLPPHRKSWPLSPREMLEASTTELECRLWSSLKGSGDECWIPARLATTPMGYGQLTFKQQHFVLHRLAFEVFYRLLIPYSFDVRHTCKTRCCSNPSHLYLAVRGDAQREAVRRRKAAA